MFITKANHRAAMEALERENAELRRERDRIMDDARTLDTVAKKFQTQRDQARGELRDALAELAPLKAARKKSLANLTAHNERRRKVVA